MQNNFFLLFIIFRFENVTNIKFPNPTIVGTYSVFEKEGINPFNHAEKNEGKKISM